MQRPLLRPKKQPLGQTIKRFFDRKVEKRVRCQISCSSGTKRALLSPHTKEHWEHLPRVCRLPSRVRRLMSSISVTRRTVSLKPWPAIQWLCSAQQLKACSVESFGTCAGSSAIGPHVPHPAASSRSPSPFAARPASNRSSPQHTSKRSSPQPASSHPVSPQ